MSKALLSLSVRLLVALAALALPACNRDSVATESRAGSPEAREFNQQTSENSKATPEGKDSAAAPGRKPR